MAQDESLLHQARDKHLVRLVRRLVETYIKSSNTIVLLTCSMEGDVANSTASMIVREMNATDRCIGRRIHQQCCASTLTTL